jgi:hypothetical protein
MRALLVLSTLLILTGCVAGGLASGSYDPQVYDAGGNAVAAMPVPPPPECREIERNVTIAGQQQRAYGEACRQSDGSWRFVN